MNRQLVRRASLSAQTASPAVAPPKISPRFLRVFSHYSESYLTRSFNSVRLLKNSAPKTSDALPLVVYLNHSSWWDPLVCLFLARQFFPARASYGPIEAAALARYQFFRRLGFFGVEMGSSAGARRFLETAGAILRMRETALWITPQGRFADFHARPVNLERGLAHLTRQAERVAFIPLAVQYVFWEERQPEILLGFGEQIIFDQKQTLSTAEATALFQSALASTQDHLAAASARRDLAEWETLRRGRARVHFFYDAWRQLRARLRGEKFDPAHSDL